MRTSIIWSAVTILLLAATMAAPALPDQASLIAAEQEGDDNRGNDSDGDDEDNPGQGNGRNDEGDDDDNRGHGNDSDGDDEDNPGQGNGGDDDMDDDGNGDASINVVNAGDYTVEVTCEHDASSNQTECTFTGAAPEGGKDIGHIDLPDDAVCTEVIDGDYEFVDPDPNTGVTGYKSKGSEGSSTLLLDGDVTVAGSTSYWFKVSGEVFPVTGPGLHCGDLAAGVTSQSTPTSGLDSTPAVDTGTLVVNTYRCTDVPADTASFDWFGTCDPTGGEHEFTIARVDTDTDDQEDQRSEASGPSGSAAFGSLATGTYQLEIVDTDWCHAESDNVTTDGDVVIDTGQTTTVWGFVCDDGTKQ